MLSDENNVSSQVFNNACLGIKNYYTYLLI